MILSWWKSIIQDEIILQYCNNRIALLTDSQMAENYKKLQVGDNIWVDVSFGSSKHNGGYLDYNNGRIQTLDKTIKIDVHINVHVHVDA